ncbi:methyltransferase [Legionella gratiana]|uniref:Methyltransferase n=1 Tax=Legionella gratiana TaxID=45066 RepID=A0A378JGG3_9GAMM|nr:methyltransferase [Legionella gratiana]KTD10963.1 methyltransferase [Legionella gratiana]STX45937.1 methyltransferase [Legionella gratiana]
MSWFKRLFAVPPEKKHHDTHTYLIAQKDAIKRKNAKSVDDFYENYFSLIATGARLKLVEAMFNLNLFALFERNEFVLEQEIIEKLGLMPIRAQKWLHLLSCEYFLIKNEINGEPVYKLTDEFYQWMLSDQWWSMQFFFNSWNVAAEENLTDVLRYGKVKTSVSWPPKKDTEVVWLEDWMMNTAEQPIRCILEHINFKKVTALLDVGGGDGTMACAFVREHPHLKAAVYNLPKPASIARKAIADKNLSDRVHVIEGDFIKEDTFPVGFDLILFTRVLFDWNEKVDRKLLAMAYQALPKNGLVGICEFYKEENHDRCLSAEYRYIFHDDFTPHVMKTTEDYRRMLTDAGFTITQENRDEKPAFFYCSLILAQK